MAICNFCKQEMLEVDGCLPDAIATVDGDMDPIRFGSEVNPIQQAFHDGKPRRCDDCGVLPGNCHHPGCDIEECPRCEGQIITCDCVVP